MRPLYRLTLIAAVAAALITGASLSIGENRPAEAESALLHAEPVPAPVVGDHLFASAPPEHPDEKVAECMSASDTLAIFALDVETVGGEILMMTDGAQQAFSDAWRRAIDDEPVEVTMVLAHAVPSVESEPIFDVVEFNGEGCALSRTLLTAADWDELLQRAAGYAA